MEVKPHYYSNPAFCQKSEFYNKKSLNPRQSPVGAQTIPRILDGSFCEEKCLEEEVGVQEQEFYEEVVVDSKGFITDKKFVVVAQNNEGKKYIRVPQSEPKPSRYALPEQPKIKPKITRSQSQRYEYIPMQEQDNLITPKSSPSRKQVYDDIEITPGRMHRYAVIEPQEETDFSQNVKNNPARYALVPVDYYRNKSRYEYIQEPPAPPPPPPPPSIPKYHQTSPQRNLVSPPPSHQSPNRYEYVRNQPRYEYIQHSPKVGNPIATQKLHELLSTPKRSTPVQKQMLSPQKVPQFQQSPPKAQQKLNYTIGVPAQQDKRTTAIVAPICSSPVQSVYGETTETWSSVSTRKDSTQVTLAFAALIMLICGGMTSGLGFYMNYVMGRHYFLDFGIVAGFTCFVLGVLGFKTRNIYWLPNRNYISGYLLLMVFSILTCAGLLVLLLLRPRPGTPTADMTSGAVCGISVFSLVLASTGVISSYCCKYPPPDNRVQHSVEGFRV